jgi:type II secretory pathway component GspD/PulD (secretin)
MRAIRHPLVRMLLLGTLFALAGCHPPPDRAPLEASAAPELRPLRVPEALVMGDARIRLPVLDAPFVLNAADPSDPLPAAILPTAEFYDVGVLELLEQLFASAHVPITVIAAPAVDNKRLTIIQRRPIELRALLEQVSIDAGFFYTYREGVLRLSPDRSFAVTLPPVGSGAVAPQSIQSSSASSSGSMGSGAGATGGAGNAAAGGSNAGGSAKRIDEGLDIYTPIAQQITSLGGTGVVSSRINRMIIFSASRDKLPMIERYLSEIRARGKLIIVDTWIVDVQLSNGSNVGIDWSKAQLNIGGGRRLNFSGSNTAIDGFSLGFSGTFGRVALDVLANFLAEQGTATTVAAPRLLMVSGSRADFSSGENIPYVQAVNLSQGTSGTLLAGGNVVYANVGLAMSVVADAIDDTVFLALGVRTSSLIEFRRFEIGTVVSDAPRLSERIYSAEVRLPIGDAVVINGIRQSGDSVTAKNIPVVGEVLPLLAGRNSETRSRSELVIVLRPRVVEFQPQRGMVPMPAQLPGRAPALPSTEGVVPPPGPAVGGKGDIDRELERDGGEPIRILPPTTSPPAKVLG